MKNFLSKLWSTVAGPQRNDVEFDRRLTVGSPSGFTINWTLKLVSVLAILLTVGSGNAWGDTHTLGWGSASGSSGTYTNFTATSGTVNDIVSFTTAKNSGSNPAYNSSSSELRLYYASNGSGGSITLTPASGVTITGFTITTSTSPTTKYKVGNGSLNTITLSKNTGSITGLSVGSSSSITIQNCNTTNTQLRIKTIQITYTASCTKIGAPTVTATPGNGRIDLSWSNQTGASSYTVTKTPSGGSVGTPSKSGSTWSCAITGLTNGTTYTWSVEAVGSGDYCASGNTAASASATPNVFRTITYYDKDGQHTTSLADGTNIATALTALYGGDDPVSCDATNYEYFVGWKVGEISGTASSVTLLDDEVVNASSPSNNYYAVWSDTDPSAGGWTKVTSISVGDVVVFAYDDAYKEMTSVTTTGTTYGSPTTVDPYPDDLSGDYALTVEAGNGGTGFSFKHGSVYLSWSSGNSLTTSGTKADASSWTISESSSGNFKFANVGTTSRILQYNSGSPRWACYGNSGQSAFQIYKQSGGGDAEYITTCCTALGSINGSVNWSSVSASSSTATLSWANNSNASGYSVTCTPSGGTVGSITGSTTKSCAVTGLTPGTEYTLTINATGKSGYCNASQEIVAKAPKITAGSASGTSTYIAGSGPGSIQTFTVSGAGLTGNLTVQAPTNFLVSTDNGSSWSTSGGSKTITVSTPPSDLASTTVKFRLAAGLSANSYGPSDITISGGNAASVTVAISGTVSPACSAPTITAHPTGGVTYRVNVTATALSVTATKNGTGPDLTYQWYSNTSNNNTTGTIIAGATSRTYTPPTSTPGTKYYYCEVSSGACMTASNCAAITVSTPSIATANPSVIAFGDRKVDGSYTATFTISGSNLANNTGLTLSVAGTASAMYSIDKTSIAQTSTGTVASTEVTVTYHPTTAAVHGAGVNTYVLIQSTGAVSTSVALSGTGKWEVTWKANDVTQGTTLVANNTKPTLPDNPSSCDGTSTTFIGWTQTAWTGKQNQDYVDALTTDVTKVHTSNSTMSNITANGTVYHAVFAKETSSVTPQTASFGFEEASPSAWTISNINQYASASASGSYSGKCADNGNGTITTPNTIQYNTKLTTPTSISFKTSKSSNNTNSGNYWNIQYSSDGSSWSSLDGSEGPNHSTLTTGTFSAATEVDLSSLSDVYIRINHNGSSPATLLDDIVLSYQAGGTTYSDYMTTCCDKNITLSDPTITGTGATITFDKTSPVATCDGNKTVTATVTVTAGYQVTALSFSGGSVSVSPTISTPITTTTNYTLTFTQDTNASLTTTATAAAKPLNGISISPSSGEVYVGQYADFTVAYDPADYLSQGYTLDATPTFVTKESAAPANTKLRLKGGRGSGPGASITATVNETVTIKASGDNTKKASVNMTVNPLPRIHFVDLVHGKEFADVVATIDANALSASKTTPVSVDWSTPNYNDCEEDHVHLVGWILSTWADANPNATHDAIVGAGATNFYAPGAAINVLTNNGNTYYAVWAKEE